MPDGAAKPYVNSTFSKQSDVGTAGEGEKKVGGEQGRSDGVTVVFAESRFVEFHVEPFPVPIADKMGLIRFCKATNQHKGFV